MEYHFSHPKSFRYHILNEGTTARKALYVLHGYGQLAEFFIRKFRALANDYVIIAPEGMHRFYLQGTSGRIGASWMTKEDRQTDISDNLSYLDALDDHLSKQYHFEKKYLLGFSQGGATAARWNQLGKSEFDAMILWASVFPPDLPNDIERNFAQNNYFVIGDEDEYYSKEEQERVIEYYVNKHFQIKQYHGKHDIANEPLTEILAELSNK